MGDSLKEAFQKFLEGDGKAKPDTKLRSKFIAVIFANGEDDDTPGLIAAFKNEPVQYGPMVYKPGVDVEVFSKRIAISAALVVNGVDYFSPVVPHSHPRLRITAPSPPPRLVIITDCTFKPYKGKAY